MYVLYIRNLDILNVHQRVRVRTKMCLFGRPCKAGNRTRQKKRNHPADDTTVLRNRCRRIRVLEFATGPRARTAPVCFMSVYVCTVNVRCGSIIIITIIYVYNARKS